MRALVRHSFGTPDVLQVEELPTPEPRPREVRIRVRAASLNLGDWELLTGRPRWITVLASLFAKRPNLTIPEPPDGTPAGRTPKFKVLGSDLAGTVEAVGGEVTRWKVGDDVFGDCGVGGFGAFAEAVCVSERAALARKPAGLSFEDAAALPQSGWIALQGLRDHARVEAGQHVLINGAGGGTGTLAIQLAKHYGATVTGVDGPEKQDLMRSLGADHVIDYRAEDFRANGQRYDVILDMAAHESVLRTRRSLTEHGIYLLGGGAGKPSLQACAGPVLSPFGRGRVKFLLAASKTEDLDDLARLHADGILAPLLDGTYSLEEARDAFQRIGAGVALGKPVLVP